MSYVAITVDRKVWGSNQLVPGTNPHIEYQPEGQTMLLPEINVISDPVNTVVAYYRQFWIYKAMFFTSVNPASIPAQDMRQPAFNATCWYSLSGGPVPQGIYTNAFSIGNNEFLNESPIQGVSPAGIWSAGSFVPSDSGEVRITAKAAMGTEAFRHWFVPGAAVPVSYSQELTVAQGSTIWPIAFYGPSELPDLRERIRDLIEILIDRLPHINPPGDPATVDIGRGLDRLKDKLSRGLSKGDDLGVMLKNPEKVDRGRLKQGLAEVDAEIGRLEILKSNISDALEKHK